MAHDILLIALVTGYLLDLLLGDPSLLPHPIRLFGYAIGIMEHWLNKGKHRLFKGFITTLFLTASTYSIFYGIDYAINHVGNTPLALKIVYTSLFVFFGIANKSLITEGKNVIKALDKSIDEGRKQLSCIVGRDTTHLNEQEIKTAVLETISENLSDGVIAPLFFFAIGGIPALMTYKMVNTLDSMIGYKNERYLYFGRTAAKLDDVLNFVPARLTAFLMALVSFSSRSCIFILKYGRAHASPNSGYPEAALAGILNCSFGGPNYYHGKLVHKPYIGSNRKTIHQKDLQLAFRINHLVTFLMVLILLVFFYL